MKAITHACSLYNIFLYVGGGEGRGVAGGEIGTMKGVCYTDIWNFELELGWSAQGSETDGFTLPLSDLLMLTLYHCREIYFMSERHIKVRSRLKMFLVSDWDVALWGLL
jgi:hypothetical protein